MMLLRAATLAKGYSGIRADLVHGLVALLNHQYHAGGARARFAGVQRRPGPARPRGPGPDRARARSSTAPGRRRPAGDALRAAGLAPLVLEAKEGLALTNGTDGMPAMLCLACEDIDGCSAAPTWPPPCRSKRCSAPTRPSCPSCIALRPHPGQAASAANLMALLAGSGVVASHRAGRHAGAGRLLAALRTPGARGRRGTPSTTPGPCSNGSWPAPSTTRWSSPTAGCRRAATSTARRSATWPTSWPSPWPTRHRSSERRIDRHLDPARSHGLPGLPGGRSRASTPA